MCTSEGGVLTQPKRYNDSASVRERDVSAHQDRLSLTSSPGTGCWTSAEGFKFIRERQLHLSTSIKAALRIALSNTNRKITNSTNLQNSRINLSLALAEAPQYSVPWLPVWVVPRLTIRYNNSSVAVFRKGPLCWIAIANQRAIRHKT